MNPLEALLLAYSCRQREKPARRKGAAAFLLLLGVGLFWRKRKKRRTAKPAG